MFRVFDTGENEPRFIDASRHRMLPSPRSNRYGIADQGGIFAQISNRDRTARCTINGQRRRVAGFFFGNCGD
jgi:hypothetical protein